MKGLVVDNLARALLFFFLGLRVDNCIFRGSTAFFKPWSRKLFNGVKKLPKLDNYLIMIAFIIYGLQ